MSAKNRRWTHIQDCMHVLHHTLLLAAELKHTSKIFSQNACKNGTIHIVEWSKL